MDTRLLLLFQTIILLAALGWNVIISLATKEDIREINARLDKMNERFTRIEQNHLEHITRLHVQSKQNGSK